MASLFIVIFSLLISSLPAEPWGVDADLAKRPSQISSPESCKSTCRSTLATNVAKAMIQFHQDVISPADGPRSHFIPSSSQYTLDAINRYGLLSGISMGCDRLMRENEDPWVYRWTRDGAGKLIKYNPVP